MSDLRAIFIAACVLGLAAPSRAGDVIWDFGPKTGLYRSCLINETEGSNRADDVIFSQFTALTGIDIWTCRSLELYQGTDMHVKIILDNGYGEPGEEYLRWDMAHTSYEYDGKYNGTDLYKVRFDFEPVVLRADTRYWIGVSGNGGSLGHATVDQPGDGWHAVFSGFEFSRMSSFGDLMFRLRGHAVFAPFELALEGDCPGPMAANIIGATPGGRVALLRGERGGETTISNGPCAGANIPLGNAALVETLTADAEGNAELTFDLPGACGQVAFAALDLTTCAVTEAARTYARPELYLGERITVTEGFTDFNAGGFQGFNSFDSGGINFRHVHTPAVFSSLTYNCGNGTRALYSPGARDMVGLRRSDGEDFTAIEFLAGDGWSANCPFTYLWIRAYLDGVRVADYTIDLPRSQVIGFAGGQFDELRIGGYTTSDSRNFYYESGNERGLQALTLDNVRIGLIHTGPSLSLSGVCPGGMTANVMNATPRGTVALIFGQRAGQTTIPSGPCAGTLLPISGGVQLVSTARANGQGNAAITGAVPPSACGARLVALDVATCTTSNAVRIE